MDKPPLAGNPFALMMNPEDVLQAMHRSDLLGGLKRRICKPLDKPMMSQPSEEAVFDQQIDMADDIVSGDFADEY